METEEGVSHDSDTSKVRGGMGGREAGTERGTHEGERESNGPGY